MTGTKKPLFFIILAFLMSFVLNSCSNKATMEESENTTYSGKKGEVKLITLDPGHFHAALIQKLPIAQIDTQVFVYAPKGPEVEAHLNLINQFNNRQENPTHWNEIVYTGDDFLEKMATDKKGNLLMTAGKNSVKIEYIVKGLESGLNVLADKPMIVNYTQYESLQKAFDTAGEKGLLLYDIMTERSEITTILQKEWSQIESVFGELDSGTADNPAVTKESVHHFFKYVAGKPLIRPAWFFDTEQQGEGMVDVTTHLIDLVHWECFPDKIITKDQIEIISAKRWPEALSTSEFSKVTGSDNIPSYLSKDVDENGNLSVYANGEINYKVNGIHARVSVQWKYQAEEGTGDTHYSILQGSKSKLEIRQGPEEGYKPFLYIIPNDLVSTDKEYKDQLLQSLQHIQAKYEGIQLEEIDNGYKVVVPEIYNVGHEAHFNEVTVRFLEYLKEGKLPDWEVPNMLVKYYITTKALEMANTTQEVK